MTLAHFDNLLNVHEFVCVAGTVRWWCALYLLNSFGHEKCTYRKRNEVNRPFTTNVSIEFASCLCLMESLAIDCSKAVVYVTEVSIANEGPRFFLHCQILL